MYYADFIAKFWTDLKDHIEWNKSAIKLFPIYRVLTKQYQTFKGARWSWPFLDYLTFLGKKSSVSKWGKNHQMRLDLKSTVWDFFLAVY